MKRRPIRRLLIAFAAALLAPILALSAVALFQFARSERARFEEDALRSAQEIAADLDRELGEAQAAAQALATSPYIAAGDYEAFQQQAMDFLRAWASADADDYAVILRDRDGQQLVNTRQPWGTPLPKIEREIDALVVSTKRPQVQDLFASSSGNRPMVAVRVPVLRDGDVTHVLSLALATRHIAELLRSEPIPERWSRTVFDRNDRVVARWPEHERFLGVQAMEAFRSSNAGRNQGTWVGENLEGLDVTGAYSRSRRTGWLALVGVPTPMLDEPLRTSRLLVAGLSAVALLLLIGLALLFGRRIARAISALELAAEQIAAGESVAPVATGLGEVDAVGDALALASRELKQADERKRLMIREFNHRVKNAFATVRALSFLFLHQDQPLETAREQFETRLAALAQTHDLLTRGSWDGALLRDVLTTELEPYTGEKGPRATLSGPDVPLSPRAVLALGMVFHELATNAAKYGSLSVPEGRIDVAWRMQPGEDGPDVLEIEWREAAGPAVETPQRKGFGTRLIRQTITIELSGSVGFEFTTGGFECVFRVPMTQGLTVRDLPQA